MEIVIVGAGRFGSALAQHFESNQNRVHLVERQSLWPNVESKNSVCLICVPTQNLPELLAQRANEIHNSKYVISACKGLIQNLEQTPLGFISKNLNRKKNLACLSGPSFASELEKKLPAALVISSQELPVAEALSQKFSGGNLRFYSNQDPVGVEYCGALKNVYAVLAGICQGLNLGENARASLITRALAELARFVQACGGKPLTVFGLAGVGDLFLTCSSSQSRNFRFGLGLAGGRSADDLLQELGTVEGFWTSFVAEKISKKKNVRAPLLSTTTKILNKKLSFQEAFEQLISRKTRGEFEK